MSDILPPDAQKASSLTPPANPSAFQFQQQQQPMPMAEEPVEEEVVGQAPEPTLELEIPTQEEEVVAPPTPVQQDADIVPTLKFDDDPEDEEPAVVDEIYQSASASASESVELDEAPSQDDIEEYGKQLSQLTDSAVSIPCGNVDQMSEVYQRDLEARKAAHGDDNNKAIITQASLMNFTRACETFSNALYRAIEKHPDKKPTEILGNDVDGINATGTANIFAMHKDDTSVRLQGKGGFLSLMGLSGTIRRINLFSSGLQLQIHAPTIGQIMTFQNDLQEATGQYGRSLNTPYFVFADAHITDMIVNRVLPELVVTSNYGGTDTSWDRLKELISYQDYQSIMVTLLSLMYPSGIKTSFTCGNPECRHVESLNFDLSKLILVNRDLLSPEALAHLHIRNKVTDADLFAYHEALNLDRTIEVNYDVNGTKKSWTVKLRQCSLAQYTAAAQAYLDELRTMKLKDGEEVDTYIFISTMRMMKPWISKITGHFQQGNQKLDVELVNDETTDAYISRAIDEVLSEWQRYCPEVRDRIVDYILDTRISHVAFYYPKCPVCGAKTSSGYGGYIPYDAQAGFFNLSRLLVILSISQKSTGTTTS